MDHARIDWVDQGSDDDLMDLMRAVLWKAKQRIGVRDYSPYGFVLALDGSLGWMGSEGSHSVEELMRQFKTVKEHAAAFVIAVMLPTGNANGECQFFTILELRHGRCALSGATVRDEPGTDLDIENEWSIPASPELFITRQ